ncbi:MAG: BrnA antitoxin family protein [Candidatus Sumerlaeaceae bacterium]|nr:BrnA antitoxin family protein [Candidatus Sumerlaeaceae bacterium]
MRKTYNFTEMTSRKNPYAARLTQPVTIRLDRASVAYFKAMAAETGLPYQNLINLYLRDCVAAKRKIRTDWKPR